MAKKTKKKINIKKINSEVLPPKKNNRSKKKTTTRETTANCSMKQAAARFKPGQSGNPAGKKKGTKNKYSIADLFHSLQKVEKKEKQTLLTKYCERAFRDDDPRVMLHLIERFLPALRAIEMSGDIGIGMLPQEALKSIQEELRNNYDG